MKNLSLSKGKEIKDDGSSWREKKDFLKRNFRKRVQVRFIWHIKQQKLCYASIVKVLEKNSNDVLDKNEEGVLECGGCFHFFFFYTKCTNFFKKRLSFF